MNAQAWLVAICLVLAIAGEWLCLLGLLFMRNPYDRLHAISPANILPPILIVAAILIAKGFVASSAKIILIALTIIVASPVLSHAIARAARLNEKGELSPNE